MKLLMVLYCNTPNSVNAFYQWTVCWWSISLAIGCVFGLNHNDNMHVWAWAHVQLPTLWDFFVMHVMYVSLIYYFWVLTDIFCGHFCPFCIPQYKWRYIRIEEAYGKKSGKRWMTYPISPKANSIDHKLYLHSIPDSVLTRTYND